MAVYGLTTTGFVTKSFAEHQEEMDADLRAAFGNSINLTNGVLAKFRDIMCERFAELWEVTEQVNSSQDPDKAVDTALEAIGAITGSLKRAATSSKVVATLTGAAGTLVTTGSRGATVSTQKKFATDADATIVAVPAWVAFTAYAVGARVTNVGNVYQCTVADTSNGFGGPMGTGTDIIDGAVRWDYLGAGVGAVDVMTTCTETGPFAAFARDLTVIDTPVGGWQGVINVQSASLGAVAESNEDFRARRQAELSQIGATTPGALRAALLQIEGVSAATVFTNNTDTTDADGVPPHAVEALVRGGLDQTIWDTLWNNVAAGVATHGTSVGTSTDSQETIHTVKFSRPLEIPIYIVLGVTKDAKNYPTTGDDLVKEAIVEWGEAQASGKDSVPSVISAQAFQVTGMLGVDYIGISTAAISTPTVWTISTVYGIGNVVTNRGRVYRCTAGGTSAAVQPGPTNIGTGITDGTVTWEHLGETIAISLRQLATYATANIAVISTSGTP